MVMPLPPIYPCLDRFTLTIPGLSWQLSFGLEEVVLVVFGLSAREMGQMGLA